MLVQNSLQAPKPHPHPIFIPTIIGYVGYQALPALGYLARGRRVKIPQFHIDGDPNSDSGTAGQPERPAIDDWAELRSSIDHWHSQSLSFCNPSVSSPAESAYQITCGGLGLSIRKQLAIRCRCQSWKNQLKDTAYCALFLKPKRQNKEIPHPNIPMVLGDVNNRIGNCAGIQVALVLGGCDVCLRSTRAEETNFHAAVTHFRSQGL